MRPAWVEVDLAALRHNLREARRIVGLECEIIAVVKANGYGLGLVEAGKCCEQNGADSLGVALVEEALELRESGVTCPILVLGQSLPEQAGLYAGYDLAASVGSPEIVDALSRAAVAADKAIRTHVKVDTGMGRQGAEPDRVPELVGQVVEADGLELAALWSHLATADEDDESFAREQYRSLLSCVRQLARAGLRVPEVHLANSAAMVRFGDMHMGAVRPGLALAGVDPCPGWNLFGFAYREALKVKARITLIKAMPPGTPLSYGRAYTTTGSARIATLPIGYADGYDRRLSNAGQVLVGNERVPVVGRVCMDQVLVDVTLVPEACVGDEAILLGSSPAGLGVTPWEMAEAMGAIPYEVLTSLGARLPRVYVGGESNTQVSTAMAAAASHGGES